MKWHIKESLPNSSNIFNNSSERWNEENKFCLQDALIGCSYSGNAEYRLCKIVLEEAKGKNKNKKKKDNGCRISLWVEINQVPLFNWSIRISTTKQWTKGWYIIAGINKKIGYNKRH